MSARVNSVLPNSRLAATTAWPLQADQAGQPAPSSVQTAAAYPARNCSGRKPHVRLQELTAV